MGIRLLPNSVDAVSPAAIEAAYKQTIDLIGNLIRMQDVLCRWDNDTLIVAFYNTNKAEADTVLARIKGLLSPGENGIGVSSESIIMEVGSGPGRPENIIDKLMANLRHDADLN